MKFSDIMVGFGICAILVTGLRVLTDNKEYISTTFHHDTYSSITVDQASLWQLCEASNGKWIQGITDSKKYCKTQDTGRIIGVCPVVVMEQCEMRIYK